MKATGGSISVEKLFWYAIVFIYEKKKWVCKEEEGMQGRIKLYTKNNIKETLQRKKYNIESEL